MDWNFLIKNKDSLCVSTDTRNLPTGCVFFALCGETFDGNRFAAQALEQGASMAIVSDESIYADLVAKFGTERALLLPADLRSRGGVVGLQSLARAWRRELGLPIIGITGTNGKTTTKELTAAVLATKYHIYYTQGNLNNSIGVPLTLLSITRAHEMAIVEMGASHPGDIRELVEVAEPDYGLITNVGRAHLQGFGSFEGVQKTKKELYDYIRVHGGKIFRNTDNPYLAAMAGSDLPTITYTTGTMPSGTHLVGDYNAENVSAALCVGEYFGIPREQGLEAIRAYVPTNNRSQAMDTAYNHLIVDAYNANPTSMQAAINAFRGDTYILGAMRELGDYSHLEHQNIVNMLAERKADKVFLVGNEYMDTTSPYPVFDDVESLYNYLKEHPLRGCTILLKGSHSTHIEKVLPLL
ncbi:MAG: UDP-N-acetylmuramoyl-tripeptide--D-alanyl-D-alanine ligase [Paludibacteraceae bacterium]|nr:UDP-N-acetylmuramoyl-tripeptide--D-alanyl-D-alanine ligase [Bacteroidales bacterium]MDY4148534.1 UDP-N-acetylmuramoyl-tripeptide--D-alanyl-D-alanine ligase [Paludibacteraceae bacterium]